MCSSDLDHDFDAVVQACADTAREGQSGTWIVPEMVSAYRQLHRLGHAHSVETWLNGALIGGLYCVTLGRMVFGESMFAHRTDASKMALAALVAWCRQQGVALIDCQQQTSHLASLGARAIPREAFEAHLRDTVDAVPPPRWAYDARAWSTLLPAAAAHRSPPLPT